MNVPYKVRQNIMGLITPYAKKLGYTDSQIQDFALFLESFEAILNRADVMEWV